MLPARTGLLCLCLTLALLGLACSSSPAPTPTATPSPPVTGTPTPRLRLVVPGQTARADNAEITINNVRHASEDGDQQAPVGQESIFIDVTVRNTGESPFALYVELDHADGSRYERAHPPSSSPALGQAIAPGQTVEGEVAFQVEDGAAGAILKFGPVEARFAMELRMLGQ